MYDVQEWAEVRRLRRDGWTKTAIAEKLGMSRNTATTLIANDHPPQYERKPAGSMLDQHADAIAAMLDQDPKAPATVILEPLREGQPHRHLQQELLGLGGDLRRRHRR